MALRRSTSALALMILMTALAGCNLPGGAAASATPAPAATKLAPQTVGQCSNPLLPVIKGAEWSYAVSGVSTGAFTRSITSVHGDGFTEEDIFENGISRTGEWKCEDGTLTTLTPAEGLSSMIQSQGVTAEFKTTSATGVTLPAIVLPGDSWSQKFTIEGTQTIAGEESQSKGEMSYSCTAANSETVIVEAGSFEAVRVGCRINGTITAALPGLQVPAEFASVATIWYARGVGMVKTENEISGVGHSSVELTSYTIP